MDDLRRRAVAIKIDAFLNSAHLIGKQLTLAIVAPNLQCSGCEVFLFWFGWQIQLNRLRNFPPTDGTYLHGPFTQASTDMVDEIGTFGTNRSTYFFVGELFPLVFA